MTAKTIRKRNRTPKYPGGTQQTSIRLPTKLKDSLSRISRTTGKPRAAVIIDVLTKFADGAKAAEKQKAGAARSAFE